MGTNNGGLTGDISANQTTSQNPNSTANQKGNDWGFNSGDWVVNIPASKGAGISLQGGASGSFPWVYAIAGGAALWWLLRRRRGK